MMKEEKKTENKSSSSLTTESTKIAEVSRTEVPKPKLAVRIHQTAVFLRHDTLVQLLRKKPH
nr:hypothetical protein [Mycoplasmopsis bovis]